MTLPLHVTLKFYRSQYGDAGIRDRLVELTNSTEEQARELLVSFHTDDRRLKAEKPLAVDVVNEGGIIQSRFYMGGGQTTLALPPEPLGYTTPMSPTDKEAQRLNEINRRS